MQSVGTTDAKFRNYRYNVVQLWLQSVLGTIHAKRRLPMQTRLLIQEHEYTGKITTTQTRAGLHILPTTFTFMQAIAELKTDMRSRST